ncbi:VgrG-related protein [Desulfovibrio legallii]|uniref:Glycosyl hydrolase family 46 n=1 Tax=Desulfovibrio legallii TaxID=571438 RepID=A0A1G7HTE0_9BACT|nr:chitosanase [Desulfovibrio legallii]SDF03596.1 Glycosyl hydrolase family 46 [Desulfovibrio legallii]
MALSSFLIQPPSAGGAAQAAAVASRSRAATAERPADFAALMRSQAPAAAQGGVATAVGQGVAPRSGGLVLAGRSPSDLLRAQTFNKAQADLRQTKALEGLMQSMGGSSTLDLARSMGTARHLRALTQGGQSDTLRLGGAGLGDFVRSAGSGARRKAAVPAEETGLGRLSARFESGGDGIAAVGYDRNGGTSYGKYQVSSRAGSLGDFLNFLDREAPDLSRRLRSAGPGNTGSRRGAMPDAWRAIAQEQPERFEDLQEAFVRESHYEPAVEAIAQRTNLKADTLSTAMREVIWSTAVQHGPAGAARIFDRADAMSGNPADPGYERKLINNVYKIRVGQFGSSDSSVQAAVANRFKQEKMLALNLLDGGAAALA